MVLSSFDFFMQSLMESLTIETSSDLEVLEYTSSSSSESVSDSDSNSVSEDAIAIKAKLASSSSSFSDPESLSSSSHAAMRLFLKFLFTLLVLELFFFDLSFFSSGQSAMKCPGFLQLKQFLSSFFRFDPFELLLLESFLFFADQP